MSAQSEAVGPPPAGTAAVPGTARPEATDPATGAPVDGVVDRAADGVVDRAVDGEAEGPVNQAGVPLRRPNLRGDLDAVLEFSPSFRVALRGYDRWQVDSYVSWAEREIQAARRACDELAARFGANAAQLQRAEQQLARSDTGREAVEAAGRVGRMLELAADEAAALTAAGAAEAEQLVDEARSYAAALLRRAEEAADAAAARTQEAERAQADAAVALDLARRDATQLRAGAAAERTRLDTVAAQNRDRLDREAAASRARLDEAARQERERAVAAAAADVAALRAELADLQRQREQARNSLRRLTEQIGEMLQALSSSLPGDPNIVAPLAPAEAAGPPTPVPAARS